MSVGIQYETDRGDDSCPLFLFHRELLTSGRRQFVSLYAAAGLARRPLTADKALLLEAMQSGEQRSSLDAERPFRDLLDAIGDADTVPRLRLESAENQEREGAFENLCLLRHADIGVQYR